MTEAGTIHTVTGLCDPKEIVYCQCHEHLAMRKGRAAEQNAELCLDDLGKSVEEAVRYQQAGGQALVEAQPLGCCRDADWLFRISEQSGVFIVASTGFHKFAFYPEDHWLHTISQEDLTALFITELRHGMYLDGDGSTLPHEQSTIRPGIIKTAYDAEGLTERYQILFRAAVAAAIETGAPLLIHVEMETDPRPLQDFLLQEGLPAERLIFCHMDRACKDLSIHKTITGKGSYLEYDSIGRYRYHDDAREIEIFHTLLDDGQEERLLFGLDTTRGRLRSYTPSAIGLDFILTTFWDTLLNSGISVDTLYKISRENPRKALVWV